jgi:hypothetical protein
MIQSRSVRDRMSQVKFGLPPQNQWYPPLYLPFLTFLLFFRASPALALLKQNHHGGGGGVACERFKASRRRLSVVMLSDAETLPVSISGIPT